MDHTLDYLRESLSNWIDENETAYRIYHKMENHVFADERDFAKALDQDEIRYLSELLQEEMKYADQEQDSIRLGQLNEVYEQLF